MPALTVWNSAIFSGSKKISATIQKTEETFEFPLAVPRGFA
jgi:hypothetical protein